MKKVCESSNHICPAQNQERASHQPKLSCHYDTAVTIAIKIDAVGVELLIQAIARGKDFTLD